MNDLDIMELKFENFLNGDEYDRASVSLTEVVRAAYKAGWRDGQRYIPWDQCPFASNCR